MLTISIPLIPISTNQSLISVNGRLIHSAKARQFKEEAGQYIREHLEKIGPNYLSLLLEHWEGKQLELTLTLCSESWRNKDKTIKCKDLGNKEKLVTDILFDCLREYNSHLDDKQLYKIVLLKKETDKNYTIIEIREYKDENM